MLHLGQLAYTFEKTVLAQIKFPSELGTRTPKTFARLDELLKQDWSTWNKKNPSRQAKLVLEKHDVQNQYLQLKKPLEQAHFEALRELKEVREEYAHPDINIIYDNEYQAMRTLITNEMPPYVMDEAMEIVEWLREMQVNHINKK